MDILLCGQEEKKFGTLNFDNSHESREEEIGVVLGSKNGGPELLKWVTLFLLSE